MNKERLVHPAHCNVACSSSIACQSPRHPTPKPIQRNSNRSDSTINMRTIFTSGPSVTTHDGVEYTTKGYTDTGHRITHYTNEGPGGPTSTTYQDIEQHLFAMPDLLAGEKILEIAEKYTNKQMAAKIAAAAVGEAPVLTESGVAHRIRRALKAKAQAENVKVTEPKAALNASRKSNGVPTRAARVSRAKPTELSTPTIFTVDDDDGDEDSDNDGESISQLAAHKKDVGGEKKNSVVGEMTESESGAEE
jgi:hypothetical protein